MGTGYSLPDTFPIFAHAEGHYYTALELPRPWIPGILGQLFNHSLTAALGYWFGNPHLQWIWFHNGYNPGTEWHYIVASELNGDPHDMVEAEFMAGWLGTLFASPEAGEFTPY